MYEVGNITREASRNVCHAPMLADRIWRVLLLAAASATLAHLLSLLASPIENFHTAKHPDMHLLLRALNHSSATCLECTRSLAAFDQPPQAHVSDELRSPMRLSSNRPRDCAAALAFRAHVCGTNGV
jgi:hypothetical protein